MALELTAQQIIDEYSKREIRLQLKGSADEGSVVLKMGHERAIIPGWLYEQLVEHSDSVRVRLAQNAGRQNSVPQYRNVPGTTARVRVFSGDEEAFSVAASAVSQAEQQVSEVLGFYKWPLVERCNARRNAALGKPNSNDEIAAANAEMAEALQPYAFLEQAVTDLRTLAHQLREHWRAAQAAEQGQCALVTNGQVVTPPAVH